MSETVRYSGSPLAYSFSEEHQVKGAWLVDLGETVRAEFVEAPVPRRAARVRGRIDDLLTGERWASHEDHWLQVTLTDPDRPAGAMDRLRRRFPHTLALAFEPEGGTADDDRGWAERIRDRSELEIAYDFVREVRGSAASEDERDLLHEAFESFRRTEAGR
jgi:exonuclease SbcD